MAQQLTTKSHEGFGHLVFRGRRPTDYHLIQGSYQGTSADVIGHWYIHHVEDDLLDRRGPGYPTIAAALNEVRDVLELEDFLSQ